MNSPKLLYLPCPNPACPTNTRGKGKAREPVVYVREVEVVLDSSWEEHGARVMYRCTACGHRFPKP